MNKPGLTLIETIVGMTVIAIAFYSIIAMFITLAPRTARVESINKKVYLAQEKMEEALARGFSVGSSGPAALAGSFSNYTYQVLVSSVEAGNLDSGVAGPTLFKNVKVRVWGGSLDQTGTVEVVTLATSYEGQ